MFMQIYDLYELKKKRKKEEITRVEKLVSPSKYRNDLFYIYILGVLYVYIYIHIHIFVLLHVIFFTRAQVSAVLGPIIRIFLTRTIHIATKKFLLYVTYATRRYYIDSI